MRTRQAAAEEWFPNEEGPVMPDGGTSRCGQRASVESDRVTLSHPDGRTT